MGLGLGLLATFCSTATFANVLRSVDAVSLPGGRVEVKLSFNSPPPSAKGYVTEHPARIALDLPNTTSRVKKYNELGFANAQSITVVEAFDRTRMIINLDAPTSYSTRVKGNNLYVLVGNTRRGMTSTTRPETARPNTRKASMKNSSSGSRPRPVIAADGITGVDFVRGDDGEGNIIIDLSSKKVTMDLQESGSRLRLTFPKAELPVSLRNRLDVIDFATPVRYIDSRIEDDNVVITIDAKGEYDYLAWQTDNRMTVSIKERSAEQAKARKRVAYTGDKLSLNFQNIHVRAVLQILADFKNLNLVASDAVTGTITVTLKSVPWDQALDIVLQAKGLGKRLDNNVLVVAPAIELAEQERAELESQQQITELSPLYTELLQINYAEAADIATVLIGGENNRILSERGSVQVVGRTNSLLVQETRENLEAIRDLISQVDIPVRQVQIEARIVVADTNFRKELGAKWGGSLKLGSNSNNLQVGGRGSGWQGSTNGPNGSTSGANTGNLNSGLNSENINFGNNNNLFTDLAVSEATSSFAIGLLTDNTLLNLEISAMESDGGGEIVSQPKVITSDKHPAIIKSGKEIPYQEASSSGSTSVSFKEAVLSLEVTPQITPDGRIIMDIKVNNDDTTSSTSTGVPIIDTTEVHTKVLIEDGQTIVLGGIFKNTTTKGVEKVPLLGDLPGIGRLFRKDTKRDTKSETLIFITPKIVQETQALR